MGLALDEFIKYVQNREFNNFRLYSSVINHLKNYYKEDEFKFFYPRNIFNDKQTELLFFLKNGYLEVTMDENSKIQIKQFYCKVVNKMLILPQYEYSEHELKISFDNGNELLFKSVEDSNEDWKPDYNAVIKDLYRLF
ncbi:DUF3908 family protein [Bacillus sp. FJAT-29814]|uniref:DUF3908 family protein n=1 Tax=Bacillus sp. FJAT-29814 TaxID=1729688 RepID=UPI00082BFC5B|nr:DUF3908 family protein [Bacillus sp. FJAT-29814]